jgi:hypothetical protein
MTSAPDDGAFSTKRGTITGTVSTLRMGRPAGLSAFVDGVMRTISPCTHAVIASWQLPPVAASMLPSLSGQLPHLLRDL